MRGVACVIPGTVEIKQLSVVSYYGQLDATLLAVVTHPASPLTLFSI